MSDVVVKLKPKAAGPDPLTSEDFRHAMSRLASAVGVVACWDRGSPVGLLVSSVTSLSIDPPRLLFCLQKANRSHDAFFRADACSVSILSDEDQAEAERFSSAERYWERFDPAAWALDPRSPPRYRPALLCLSGTISHRMDAGTHSLFIVNVAEASVGNASPLVYFDRRFATLQPVAGR